MQELLRRGHNVRRVCTGELRLDVRLLPDVGNVSFPMQPEGVGVLGPIDSYPGMDYFGCHVVRLTPVTENPTIYFNGGAVDLACLRTRQPGPPYFLSVTARRNARQWHPPSIHLAGTHHVPDPLAHEFLPDVTVADDQ